MSLFDKIRNAFKKTDDEIAADAEKRKELAKILLCDHGLMLLVKTYSSDLTRLAADVKFWEDYQLKSAELPYFTWVVSCELELREGKDFDYDSATDSYSVTEPQHKFYLKGVNIPRKTYEEAKEAYELYVKLHQLPVFEYCMKQKYGYYVMKSFLDHYRKSDDKFNKRQINKDIKYINKWLSRSYSPAI